jgi:hypothetical protein
MLAYQRKQGWKVLGTLGDVDPVEYDGSQILVNSKTLETPVLELLRRWCSEDERGEPQQEWRLFSVLLEKFVLIEGKYLVLDSVAKAFFRIPPDLPYPIETYDEWFHSSSDGFESHLVLAAKSSGMEPTELVRMFCSENVMERAIAYETLIAYVGEENFDSYPDQFFGKKGARTLKARFGYNSK